MSYCYKCGSKMEDEDLFCPNCGAKRVDMSEKSTLNTVYAETNFKAVMDILWKMVFRPAAASKEFMNKSEKNIVIIITAFCLITQGFLGMWRVKQLIYGLGNAVSHAAGMDQFSSLLQLWGSSGIAGVLNDMDSLMGIPYGKIFWQNCFLMMLSIFIAFVMMCLVNALLSKNKSDIFKYYKTSVICAVPILYFEFFSIIVSYISINFGTAVLLFGFIVSIICFYTLVKECISADEEHIVFAVSFIILIVIIGVVLCSKSFISMDL